MKISGYIIFGWVLLLIVFACKQKAPTTAPLPVATIPDAGFERFLVSKGIDSDGNVNGQVKLSDLEPITSLEIYLYSPTYSIQSLSGIEYFKNLTSLYFHLSDVTELDVSKNLKLRILECRKNQLSKLVLNDSLAYLSCSENPLKILNVSGLKNLRTLYCNQTQLSALDIRANINLEFFECANNPIKNIDVSKNSKLSTIYLPNTELSAFDVSQNPLLRSLTCNGNKIQKLDLSQNLKLSSCDCSNNELSIFEIYTDLKFLNCANNRIQTLDLTKTPSIQTLICNNNQLTKLSVDRCVDLRVVRCQNNRIKTLNFSNNADLSELRTGSNQLQQLDITQNNRLSLLECDDNQLVTLDLRNNTLLELAIGFVNCSQNPLKIICVSDTNKAANNPKWLKDMSANYSICK
jgi:hypothetical protein